MRSKRDSRIFSCPCMCICASGRKSVSSVSLSPPLKASIFLCQATKRWSLLFYFHLTVAVSRDRNNTNNMLVNSFKSIFLLKWQTFTNIPRTYTAVPHIKGRHMHRNGVIYTYLTFCSGLIVSFNSVYYIRTVCLHVYTADGKSETKQFTSSGT